MAAEKLVVDASAMVDMLVGSERSPALRERGRGNDLRVPAHFFAESGSAGRLLLG